MSTDPAAETAGIWNRIGGWWDEYIGPEGNEFHRNVVAPVTEQLLEIRPGERVLDVACGNGQFSRRLAELGASVVAFDLSASFVERARAHTTSDRIEYHVADATDESRLIAFGEFDAAVANMALMDVPEVEPLFRALGKVLRPGGRFVFTIIHPCFGYPLSPKAGSPTAFVRLLNRTLGGVQRVVPHRVLLMVARAIEPFAGARQSLGYLRPVARLGTGIIGQPAPHWYFHRPLQVLFEPAFDAGLVLDALVEPPWPETPNRAGLLAVRLRRPVT
jgi:2-polyprenyl-3-methyl-5-hydroxy-6-metoxy-1,4-benzoquinol methylase